MLVVFPPIFVADTKIIFRYDFVAPLSNVFHETGYRDTTITIIIHIESQRDSWRVRSEQLPLKKEEIPYISLRTKY